MGLGAGSWGADLAAMTRMGGRPSSSSLNPGTQIVAAACARIYYAYPDPNSWSYSGVEGALVFGAQDNGFWFRLVDLGVRRRSRAQAI